jgi:3-hydroxyacyl-[acyl-carrier-protein] dehydratase
MQSESSNNATMDINQIMAALPHRYPFILVDRVIEHEPGVSITAIKNVTINEPFFPGHFPVRPVMPGVLIIEALAQATAILALETMDEETRKNSLYLFAGIDNVRFRRQVEPGDQLRLEATLLKMKRNIARFSCQAKVDGELAVTAELMGAVQTI